MLLFGASDTVGDPRTNPTHEVPTIKQIHREEGGPALATKGNTSVFRTTTGPSFV